MDNKTLFGIERFTDSIGSYTSTDLEAGTDITAGNVFSSDLDPREPYTKIRFLIRAFSTSPADIEGTCCDASYERKVKNHIINGNFAVWQRGKEFLGCCTRHTADRWVWETSYDTRANVYGGVRQTEFNPRSSTVVGNNGSKYHVEFEGHADGVLPDTSTYF